MPINAVFSKGTAKVQPTMPEEVREALARAEPLDQACLKAVESTLSEWASAEDTAAYDDLSCRGSEVGVATPPLA